MEGKRWFEKEVHTAKESRVHKLETVKEKILDLAKARMQYTNES